MLVDASEMLGDAMRCSARPCRGEGDACGGPRASMLVDALEMLGDALNCPARPCAGEGDACRLNLSSGYRVCNSIGRS